MDRVGLFATLSPQCPVVWTSFFPAYAQVNKNNLTGVVRDASSSAIPGVGKNLFLKSEDPKHALA